MLSSLKGGVYNAQVLSPRHAETFSAMEYFNTYGGCTAAGAAGAAVLKVLQEEQLQQHAQRVGEYLLSKLAPIKQVCTSLMQGACMARGGIVERRLGGAEGAVVNASVIEKD